MFLLHSVATAGAAAGECEDVGQGPDVSKPSIRRGLPTSPKHPAIKFDGFRASGTKRKEEKELRQRREATRRKHETKTFAEAVEDYYHVRGFPWCYTFS